MKLGKAVGEGFAYAFGVLLSLGPSQIFGLVKGSVDLVKFVSIRSKINNLKSDKNLNEYKAVELTSLKNRAKAKQTSLKADALALLPFIGAIVSWRMYSPKFTGGSAVGIQYSAEHLSESFSTKLPGIFYPLRSEKNMAINPAPSEALGYKVVKISVASQSRELDARLMQHDSENPRKTVVLFHGNGMVADEMADLGQFYFSKGFDVLLPTMGGYPGSPGVSTNEESSYHDVEAIKLFFDQTNIKEAGYHGLSIGGSLAFQAAAGNSAANVKTLFVVADQTFTKIQDAAVNVIVNKTNKTFIKPVIKGAVDASFPKAKITLSKGVSTLTDGLDNLAKAKKLKESDIPLMVIKTTKDILMGNKEGENLGDRLLEARYDSRDESHEIAIDAGHAYPFTYDPNAQTKMSSFLAHFRDPSWEEASNDVLLPENYDERLTAVKEQEAILKRQIDEIQLNN